MKRKRPSVATMIAFVALAVATPLPASAQATTVRLGPEVPPTPGDVLFCGTGGCPGGVTFAQLVSPDAPDEAPASGMITTWRVAGHGELKLRVLRPDGEEEDELVAEGTSTPATNLKGGANATSLPIRAGDAIGVDTDGEEIGVKEVGTDTAVLFEWSPALANEGGFQEPVFGEPRRSTELLLNADIVLAPIVSAISPTSGSTAAGNTVTIVGNFLDGATSVTFGSVPAASFSVNSSNQITATAPAEAASTVDVHVTGPGGTSEATTADKYTFTAPPAIPAPKTLIQGGPALALASPDVTGFSESATKWRRGHSLPHISSARPPVGTTFSFSLNEPATATLTFTQSVAGRRSHGRCVAPSKSNGHKPRCKRTVAVGSFGVAGNAGQNNVRFQGRLSSAKTLKPGTYAVSITARNAHGVKGVSRSVSFKIVS